LRQLLRKMMVKLSINPMGYRERQVGLTLVTSSGVTELFVCGYACRQSYVIFTYIDNDR